MAVHERPTSSVVDDAVHVYVLGAHEAAGLPGQIKEVRILGKVFAEGYDADGNSLGKSSVAIIALLTLLKEGIWDEMLLKDREDA